MQEKWREANVTAIFKKKGSRCEPGNYRPVSLTSQIGKIFERLLRDRIVSFLEENGKLRDSQHGFRAKRSCLTNLLEFSILLETMWIRGCQLILCIWISKRRLIRYYTGSWCEDEEVGLDERMVRWIGNWLSDRRQRVVINGVVSVGRGWRVVFPRVRCWGRCCLSSS